MVKESIMTKKELFLCAVKDCVADLFYKVSDVDKLVSDGEITFKEIVETFEKEILENLLEIKRN